MDKNEKIILVILAVAVIGGIIGGFLQWLYENASVSTYHWAHMILAGVVMPVACLGVVLAIQFATGVRYDARLSRKQLYALLLGFGIPYSLLLTYLMDRLDSSESTIVFFMAIITISLMILILVTVHWLEKCKRSSAAP